MSSFRQSLLQVKDKKFTHRKVFDMREFVFCLILFGAFVLEVVGLRCYSCNNFDTSEDCMNVTDCGGAEGCYARADGLTNGKVQYTVGCTRYQLAVKVDTTFCVDVCLQGLCNLNKCNMPVSPEGKPKRAPRCFSCELIASPTTCTNITQCAFDEICYVREVTVYGNKRYRLGCINKQHCSTGPPATDSAIQIVGKRDVNSTDTSSSCSLCCENDHCNKLACESNQLSTSGLSHDLLLLEDNDTCVDKNEDACAVFGTLDSNACTAIPKVDYMCPKTCGICGHFGWSQWSGWSDCSASCDEGISERSRSCLYQIGIAYPHNCEGNGTEKESCVQGKCPTEGIWTEWGSWSTCSRTCSNGTSTRSRDCHSISQRDGAVYCNGSHIETEFCNQQTCPLQTTCPDNWVALHQSCYFFGQTDVNFTLGQSFCHGRRASLVHIESSSENTFIVEHLQQYSNPSNGWWIGMTDIERERYWKWTDTNQAVTFTNWYGSEGHSQYEDCCAVVQRYNFMMSDVTCGSSNKPLCERRTSNS